MGNIERWLCLDCLNAFETPEEGVGHWADDEGQAICDGPLTKVVPANHLEGAVEESRAVAVELRALGDEWRGEWPDGRVCKAELNRLADRLGGQYEASPAPPSSQLGSGTEPNKED